MKELGDLQYAAFWISCTDTPLKRAHEVLTLRVSCACGTFPGARASGPAAWIAATTHLEIVSRDAGENGSLVIIKSWSPVLLARVRCQ